MVRIIVFHYSFLHREINLSNIGQLQVGKRREVLGDMIAPCIAAVPGSIFCSVVVLIIP